MKSFDEWRNAQRTQVNGYTERDAFEAGQQSKQAEIDELQKRINQALVILDNFNCPQEYGVEEVWEATAILLGDENDN